MADWKSTVSGILTGLIGTCSSVVAFLAPYMLTAPASTQALCGKWILGLNLGAIIGKVWLGVVTKNADAAAAAEALNQLAAKPGTGTPFVTADLTAPTKAPDATLPPSGK